MTNPLLLRTLTSKQTANMGMNVVAAYLLLKLGTWFTCGVVLVH